MTDAKKPWEQQYDGVTSDGGSEPWKQDYGPDVVNAPAAPRGLKGWGQDIAATAIKGAIGVPESVVGLADIPTGGAVGKFLENEGGTVGLRFKQAREVVNDWHSDATKDAQRKFDQANGVVDKAAVALQNPSLIASAIGESLPAMGAGGVAARGLMAGTRLAQMGAKGAALAGAAGEGITAAGSAAEQIRQETGDGLLTPGQAAAAVGTGLATGALGAAAGKVANRLGIGDAETMMAQGTGGMAKQFADDAAGAAVAAAKNPMLADKAVKGIPTKVIQGAISEGLLEELPQSMSEQILQNLALGKDWSTDLDSAAVMGVLSGGAMGAGAAGFHATQGPHAGEASALAPVQSEKALQLGYQPDPLVAFPDGTVGRQAEIDAYLNGMPENERMAARAKLMNINPQGDEQAPKEPSPGMQTVRREMLARLTQLKQEENGEPSVPQTSPPDGAAALAEQQAQAAAERESALAQTRAIETPDDEIHQSTGMAERPSVAMGLDASHGSLSAAAVKAVDSGASTLTRAAAAASAAQTSPAQQAPAEAVKQPATANAQTPSGIDPETGEVSTQAQMAELKGRIDYMKQQGAAQGWNKDMVAQRNALQSQLTKLEVQAAKENAPTAGETKAVPAKVTGITQILAKQVPSMSTDELQQAIAHYGPNHKRTKKLEKELVSRSQQSLDAIEQGAINNGPQTTQTQQSSAQPSQARAAQASTTAQQEPSNGITGGALGSDGQGVSNGGAQTVNHGAQASAPTSPQAQAPNPQAAPAANVGAAQAVAHEGNAQREQQRQRLVDASERWTRMPTVERQALAGNAKGLNPITKKNVHSRAWADLSEKVRGQLAEAIHSQTPVPENNTVDTALAQANKGDVAIDNVAKSTANQTPVKQASAVVGDEKPFSPSSGTLGIPREEMPQVPTANHGGLVKHLNAQGIAHETKTVDAADLKPTQAEYSPSKVEAAKASEGDRAVIVSKDGHIIDGHHQAVAAAEDGKQVKAIVLDAPVEQALEAVKASPSANVQPQEVAPKTVPQRMKEVKAAKDAAGQRKPSEPKSVPAKMREAKKKLAADQLKRAESGDQEAVFSTAAAKPAKSMAVHEVQSIADRVLKDLGVGAKVRLQTFGKASESGLHVPPSVVPMGATSNGQIYLFAESLGDPLEVFRVVVHEVFHLGLSKSVQQGAYIQKMLGFLSDPQVRQYANRWKKSEDGVSRKASMPVSNWQALAVEESLSDLAEQLIAMRDGIGSKPMAQWARRMAARMAQWADSLGLDSVGKRIRAMTQTETERFIAQTLARADSDAPALLRGGRFSSERAAAGKGVAQSRSSKPRPNYSPAARMEAVRAVEGTADAIRKAWANGPEVVVAFDMQDPVVPESARRADLKQRSGGARGAPEGFYYKGKVYLMASKLKTPNDAARVLFHETLGHHGLRGLFGKDLAQILNQVATMRKPLVDAKIKEYGLRGVNKLDRRAAAEEVLAEMAQNTPQIGFVQRAVAAIRTWLRTHVPGFKSLALSDDELIRNYILPARAWVESGGVATASWADRMAFSLASNDPAEFVQSPSGSLDFGEITPEMGGAMRRQAGKIRLRVGNEAWGLKHIEARHGEQFKKLGFESVSDFVAAVAQDFNAIYSRDGAGLDVVLASQRTGQRLVVQLEPHANGDFYDVKTASPIRADQFKNKKPLWENAGTSDSTTQGSSPFPRDQSGTGSVTPSQIGRNDEDDEPMFSRAKVADLKDSAISQVQAAFSHPGKVSLWDKTVGTMRNLAERAPAFKPVYEAAQQNIDDVSMLANDAADTAPRILPRVESWRDLKKQPVSATDNAAVAKPLFEATLIWARDEAGKPTLVEDLQKRYANLTVHNKAAMLLKQGKIDAGMLRMWQGLPADQYEKLINSRFESKILKPGIVFSDSELRSLFKTSDDQISLYREARGAIDRSIDMTARTDMLRIAGEKYEAMRDAVLEQPSVDAAAQLLLDTLEMDAKADPDSRDRLAQYMQQIKNRLDTALDLQKSGYAPLSRFGRYTVDVVDAKGERQYFGMYETMRDANLAKLQLAQEFKGATISQGTMSAEAYKLFAGVTPETLEQFGEMLGLKAEGNEAQDKAFQEFLKLTKNNHSAMKRMIHRKGIAGFSEDVGRVVANFVYSNARAGAMGLNAGKMDKAIGDIPKDQGELKDLAMGLRSYIRDPQEEGQAVRGMLFAQYLGGSLASAFVNTTQPFAVTLPWLSQYGGMKKAAVQMAKALKDMGTKGFKYEPDLAKALQSAEDDGVVSPQEIHQLMAQARGAGMLRAGDGTKVGDARAKANNLWEQGKVLWGQPFALAEQFNRRSTFIAAYRTAKEQGMNNPSQFARDAVIETQFQYSKANKPNWARGSVGGTLFTFKTYSVSYLELINRMWHHGGPEGKRAVGWAFAMLALMGGAGGMPFMEDLEDLIDGIGQMMGYNMSAKQWRKQAMADIVGKELASFLEQGISGLPGAPVDVSGRLGMGNLIPGTGLLLSKQSRERDLLEIVGPAGDFVSRSFTAARKALTGDVGGAALEVAPTAVRNAAKGIDMAASGMYKDSKGYKVIDTTLAEAAAKFIGFQAKSVADVQEANSLMLRSKGFYTQQSSEIKAQWADALFRKDDAALERVRERLADWNKDNPEQPIIIKMPDVWKKVREMGKDRTARIADTAPKAIRAEMREMAKDAR